MTHREANMALYYLLLRGWVVFGHGEIALRSLSVILAVGALWVVIMLARSLFGRRVALLAGLLLAVDPLYVQFAQDVRGYSLALLLVSASCFFFVRGIRQVDPPSRFCWTAYTAVTALAAYSNFWAALVPVGQALSLAFLPPGRIPWRRMLTSAVALVVLLVPLGLLIEATDSAGVNWASGSSAGRLFTHIRASTFPMPCLDLLVLVAVVAVVAVIVLARRRPAFGAVFDRQWPLFFTLCWLVVPVAAVVMLSLVDRPLLVVRYLMVSLPAAILLVAAGDRPGGIPGPSWRGRHCRRAARRSSSARRPSAPRSGTPRAGHRTSGRRSPSLPTGLSRATACSSSRPYERIPVEWYMGDRPAAERAVHPVYPATAWGVDPLAFDGSVSVRPGRHRAGRLAIPAHLAPERNGRPLLVPRAGGRGRRRAPASGVHAGRHHALPRGGGHRRGAAMSRPRLGTSLVVGGLVAAAAAGHVLYPAWLAWRTRGGRGRVGGGTPGAGHREPRPT